MMRAKFDSDVEAPQSGPPPGSLAAAVLSAARRLRRGAARARRRGGRDRHRPERARQAPRRRRQLTPAQRGDRSARPGQGPRDPRLAQGAAQSRPRKSDVRGSTFWVDRERATSSPTWSTCSAMTISTSRRLQSSRSLSCGRRGRWTRSSVCSTAIRGFASPPYAPWGRLASPVPCARSRPPCRTTCSASRRSRRSARSGPWTRSGRSCASSATQATSSCRVVSAGGCEGDRAAPGRAGAGGVEGWSGLAASASRAHALLERVLLDDEVIATADGMAAREAAIAVVRVLQDTRPVLRDDDGCARSALRFRAPISPPPSPSGARSRPPSRRRCGLRTPTCASSPRAALGASGSLSPDALVPLLLRSRSVDSQQPRSSRCAACVASGWLLRSGRHSPTATTTYSAWR